MNINDFAEFVFIKNVNDALVELSLGGVENNLDLFCFFVDLVCKGLVLLFGKGNKVEIDSVSMEDFKKVQHKMHLLGVDVILDVKPNENNTPVSMNVKDFESFPPNDDLESYRFKLNTLTLLYEVRFKIFRLPR
jgi:hypothetical protein